MIKRVPFYLVGVVAIFCLATLSAGCAKNDTTETTAPTAPTNAQLQAQQQTAAAAKAAAEGQAAAKAAAQGQAGAAH